MDHKPLNGHLVLKLGVQVNINKPKNTPLYTSTPAKHMEARQLGKHGLTGHLNEDTCAKIPQDETLSLMSPTWKGKGLSTGRLARPQVSRK